VEVVLENPMSSIKKRIHVKVTAADSGSGLWRSTAIAIPPWSTIDSCPFDEQGMAEYEIIPAEIPYEEMKPKSYTIELLAFDNQSNRTLTPVWVPVPESMALECREGDAWREVPLGCRANDGNVRIAVSMTAMDSNVELTPEVEVRMAGEAFTGKPTHKGQAVAYADKPNMGYVEMKLLSGSYHCRYRLARTGGPRSCWITVGKGDSSGTDFVVP
jgi:hypothetical protein